MEERLLNNRYRVDELIGRGGMADVYKGLDQLLNRPVAIKMLRTDLARDPQFQTRFRREATSSASLNHPAIVAVYDTGSETQQDNQFQQVECPFIVMEYLDGVTLRDILNDEEHLDQETAVRYTTGVLEALGYAHEHSIVHRDIKPSNVMVCKNGDVKVMDFGIARALADAGATMTQTSTVVGTAQYLSPEQARGESVDTRSDLYSAGCLLFELVTGRAPFVGDSPVAVAYQHVREESPHASSLNDSVTPELDAVIAKAMEKDREHRFQTAQEFIDALTDAQNGIFPAALGEDEPTQAMDAVTEPVTVAGLAGAAAVPATQADYADTPDEDYYEDDDDYAAAAVVSENRGSRLGRWLSIILLALALLFGAGLGGYYLINYLDDQRAASARHDIPNVSGKPQNEAQNILMDAGFRPQIKEVFSDDHDSGIAVGTTPPAGDTLPANSEIDLLISKGSEQVTIPEDLEGQSEATVRDRLTQLGLVVDSVEQVNDPDVPRDRLLATNPELGAKVKVGSGVDLRLSSGRVEVPNVVGMTEADAKEKLTDDDHGFDVEVRYRETRNAIAGNVIEQNREAGTAIEQGSTIVLTVATAPPTPTPTPTRTTDSPSPTRTSSPSPSPTRTSSPSSSPTPTRTATQDDTPTAPPPPPRGSDQDRSGENNPGRGNN